MLWRHKIREALGRAILPGLELLIAGDIIRTVAVEPTLENAMVLGLEVSGRSWEYGSPYHENDH
jgi:uncharacterized membrane protein